MHAYTLLAVDIANDRSRAARRGQLVDAARAARASSPSRIRRAVDAALGRSASTEPKIDSPRRSTLGPVDWR